MLRMLSYVKYLWRNLARRDRVERDLDEELRYAFDTLVAQKIQVGLSETAARRAATIELGRIDSIKAQVREARAGAMWDVLRQDMRYGARLLIRNPLFSLTALLSLAICIGSTTAVFSILNRLLFAFARGVPAADRLVDIAPSRADGSFAEPVVPYRIYRDIPDRLTTLEGVYAHQFDLSAMSLRGESGADRIFGSFVSSNYFTVLGIQPAAGRFFGPADGEHAGTVPMIVLSHQFWSRRFNATSAVIGQTLHINGQPLRIVGIAPEGFHGLGVLVPDVWLPASMVTTLMQTEMPFGAGGRLRAGATISQAAAELDGIGRALYAADPLVPFGRSGEQASRSLRVASASPVPPIVRGAVGGFLALLMGIATLVLVIACTNVAGVLLARATSRRREIAVRLATGAGRGRIVRQLLTETLLLFVVGGAAGLVVARLMTSALVLALPPLPLPVDTSLPLDARVISFTAAATLIAAVLSGLVPALHASKADLGSALKVDAQGPSDRLRLRSTFVIAQVAFSIALVIGAGLLGRALQRSSSVQLGFDAEGVEVATLDLSLGGYAASSAPLFLQQLVERLRATRGVAAASAATTVPLRGQTRMCCGVSVPGVTPPNGQQFFQPAWNIIEPGYFSTLRIRLLAGRDFAASDRSGGDLVAIVSEIAARRFWPGQDPIGRHVIWHKAPRLVASRPGAGAAPKFEPVQLTVIGVAGDLQTGASGPTATIYLPFQQHYERHVAIVARSASDHRLTSEIRDAVASLNPNLPIVAASRLSDRSGPVHLQLRVSASVAAAVGTVGLLLAAIGIYGVAAYAVTRRTREIGIRVALGAQRRDVVSMVLREGMSLVAVGSVVGLGLAAAGTRLLVRLLFGVPPLDPVSFGGAVALFGAVGLVACYIPVRRAIRINAVEALRYE
jgi:predicted permease